MSHIVRIQTQVRDAAAVTAACSRLKLNAADQRHDEALQREGHRLGGQAAGLEIPRRLRHRHRPSANSTISTVIGEIRQNSTSSCKLIPLKRPKSKPVARVTQ